MGSIRMQRKKKKRKMAAGKYAFWWTLRSGDWEISSFWQISRIIKYPWNWEFLKNLSAGAGEIQAKLQEICTRNGMRVKMMQVQERKAHYRLLDVFPKIRKKENGINVSV